MCKSILDESTVMLRIHSACVPAIIDKMERPIERSIFANARIVKTSVYSRSPILNVVGFFNSYSPLELMRPGRSSGSCSCT